MKDASYLWDVWEEMRQGFVFELGFISCIRSLVLVRW